MKRLDVLVVIVLALAFLGGCGTYHYPVSISCKGKGVITGSGQTSLIAGVGGGGQNSFTLSADCSEKGFVYQSPAEPDPETTSSPLK